MTAQVLLAVCCVRYHQVGYSWGSLDWQRGVLCVEKLSCRLLQGGACAIQPTLSSSYACAQCTLVQGRVLSSTGQKDLRLVDSFPDLKRGFIIEIFQAVTCFPDTVVHFQELHFSSVSQIPQCLICCTVRSHRRVGEA